MREGRDNQVNISRSLGLPYTGKNMLGLGHPWKDRAWGVIRGGEVQALQRRTDLHSYSCPGWSELAWVE